MPMYRVSHPFAFPISVEGVSIPPGGTSLVELNEGVLPSLKIQQILAEPFEESEERKSRKSKGKKSTHKAKEPDMDKPENKPAPNRVNVGGAVNAPNTAANPTDGEIHSKPGAAVEGKGGETVTPRGRQGDVHKASPQEEAKYEQGRTQTRTNVGGPASGTRETK